MKRSTAIAAGVAATLALAAGTVAALAARHADGGPPQKDMVIDAATRADVIERAAALLQARYVDADRGAALAAELRQRLKAGRYDDITSAEALARRLREDLAALSHDKHMEARYFAEPVTASDDGEPSAAQREHELFQMRWMNGGVEAVRRLPGNLGYMEIRSFARPTVAAPRLAAGMALIAQTKALIVDLRRCEGGDPDTVMQLASYLYDERTHLNDIYERYTGTTEQRWTGEVAGPRYGSARPLYVLTSADTASGCEDFAYALQANHRARLVGETTAGAAHGGSPQRLGEHFMMFVPSFRPINPVTGKDWEGVGVVPDREASAAKALAVAQDDLLHALLAVETDPEAQRKLRGALDEL